MVLNTIEKFDSFQTLVIEAKDSSIMERLTHSDFPNRRMLTLLQGVFLPLTLDIRNPVRTTGLFPLLYVMAVGKSSDVIILSTHHLGVSIIPSVATNSAIHAHVVYNNIAKVFASIDFDSII